MNIVANFDFFFRKILAFIMIPVIQREINIFKDKIWNVHRIRQQKDTILPAGVPNHIYDFPENYGLKNHGKGKIYYSK